MTVNFLIQKNIITLVPIKETFFHSVEFTNDKKLSIESVLFNYQNLSPFVDSGVSYIQKDDKLQLWFYDKKYKSMFTVPEGYLYSKHFSKNYKDILVAIEDKALFAIQNHTLLYQSAMLENIDLLSKKYNIKKTLNRSSQWHQKNHKKIINQSLLPIISNFIDKKLLVKIIKEKFLASVIPLFVFISLMTATHFAINQYLQKQLDQLLMQKKETKNQIKEMFTAVTKNNQNIAFIKNYLKEHDQSTLDLLEDIANITKEHSIKFFHFDYSSSIITLQANSQDIESFLEDLSEIKLINSYKLTRQVKTKDGKKRITIEIDIKQGEQGE